MKIINRGQVNRMRKASIPIKIKNNKDFTFGLPSDTHSHYTPGKFVVKHGADSNMSVLISHSDNLREDLQKKIRDKLK